MTSLDRDQIVEPGRGASERRVDSHGRRHPLDLRRLEQFVTIVDVGSLTDAAIELGVTQQALSAAIRTLEQQLGVTLFVRSRGMRPSDVGRRLYESAQILLADASRVVRDVQAAARGRVVPLKIGYTPGLRSFHVYDVVAGLVADDVPLKLECSPPTALRERLTAGELDLALCGGPWLDGGFGGRLLGRLPINVALRAEDARDLADAEIGLKDLAEMALLRCGAEGDAVDLLALLPQCREFGFDPSVEEVQCLGLDAVATPLAADRAFAFVTDEPGAYLRNRVTVRRLREPIGLPIQAVWMPGVTSGPVSEVIAALPTVLGDRPIATTRP